MDKLDFLDGETPIDDAQPVDPAPEAAETPASAEPEHAAPVETPNPLTPPVIDVKPEPGFVPITALMDERDKRKALEAQIAQHRSPQQQVQIPDMIDDPEGYQAWQAQATQQASLNAKLDISEELARDKFGDELVDSAREWALQKFQALPGYQGEVFKQRNPYRFIVEQYQREQIASQVDNDDWAQFQAWKQAQGQLAQQPQAAQAAQPQTPSAPPQSIASLPSAGGVQHVATGPGVAFDDIFKG